MKLGIFVNTDRHVAHVVGITKAAVAKGHEVTIFNMDTGTKLIGSPEFSELCKMNGVELSFCDHAAKGLNVKTDGLPSEMVCGSQFNNATMVHDSDRLIVL